MNIEPAMYRKVIEKMQRIVINVQNKYDVQVNLPKNIDGNDEKFLKIVGYQKKAELARDKIQEMVDKMMVSIQCSSIFCRCR